MRVHGRLLRASNLSERRVLKGALGVDVLRIPRRLNPFAVARTIKKIASGTGGNLPELRAMLMKRSGSPMSAPTLPTSPVEPALPALPDLTSEPREALAA